MPETYVSGKRGALQLGRRPTGTGIVGKSCEKNTKNSAVFVILVACCVITSMHQDIDG